MESISTSEVNLFLERKEGFKLDCSVKFPTEGITVVFGESGSGKTTFLRCVAGLERAQGYVHVGNELWQDDKKNIFLPTWQRQLGYVFQESSLFPHLSALKNLEFAIKRSKSPNSKERMETAIELLGIRTLLNRMPSQLSGGERQRVAIARAVATDPHVMLFDEPLASLDFARKVEILPWLEKLKEELKIPMLYVTHSANEVVKLADHIIVLEKGLLKASGSLQSVLSNVDLPVKLEGKLGVVLRGKVINKDSRWNLLTVRIANFDITVPDGGEQLGDSVSLQVLAKDVSITASKPESTSILNVLAGEITQIRQEENLIDSLVQIDCGGQKFLSLVTNKSLELLNLHEGSNVWIQFKSMSLSSQ